jgi:putative transposase
LDLQTLVRSIAIFMDAMFFSLRRETVQKECVIFAMGIKETGQYEILGFYMNPIENHIAYRNVLMDLHETGAEEPLLWTITLLRSSFSVASDR